MAKVQYQTNPKLQTIFDDLELYKQFCVDYGYKFDESSLMQMKSYPYQQFTKYTAGKSFKDQWAVDAVKFGRFI
jgi:hypothetical protein